jgi:hypothetical protein
MKLALKPENIAELGFFVRGDSRRIRSFKVTICDRKSERASSTSTSVEPVTICDQFTEARVLGVP